MNVASLQDLPTTFREKAAELRGDYGAEEQANQDCRLRDEAVPYQGGMVT